MKIKTIKKNPFGNLYENEVKEHHFSRILRSSFMDRIYDTFFIFFGRNKYDFFDNDNKHCTLKNEIQPPYDWMNNKFNLEAQFRLGVLDYLFACSSILLLRLLSRIENGIPKKNNQSSFVSKLKLFALRAAHVIVLLLNWLSCTTKALISCAITAACLPFISIVHIVNWLHTKERYKKVEKLKISVHINGSDYIKTLKELTNLGVELHAGKNPFIKDKNENKINLECSSGFKAAFSGIKAINAAAINIDKNNAEPLKEAIGFFNMFKLSTKLSQQCINVPSDGKQKTAFEEVQSQIDHVTAKVVIP